ncbi:MFS transporter [Paraburkholderia phymatum]|uniref:MFS transporter n=1 Tax=Paraburkholderia phymatum TaxID=148447 RepID=A0ACC6U439_9BURK
MTPAEIRSIVPAEATGRKTALFATILGNALEWYDFIVYGFMAVFIARKFFPAGDETAALLSTFATFALSFVARPIGGLLIGIYADRRGRKPALSLIMMTMTVAMLLMVFVPTYESIGVFSTVLLVVARLLQAFSSGGEFSSASTYLLESVPVEKRGFYSGLYSSGPQIATVLAAAVGLLITVGMSPETRDSWGWRIPFVIGLLIAPVGYYVRRYLPESEAYSSSSDTLQKKVPVGQHMRQAALGIVIAVALAAIVNSSSYILLVYAPTYVVKTLKLPMYVPFVALVVNGVVGMLCMPIFGALSDRLGARRQFSVSLLVLILCVVPLYSWLSTSPSLSKLMISAAIFSVLGSSISAAMPRLMAYLFPVAIRATAMGLAYNISATVFGASSLYFVTVLIAKTGSSLVPAYYLGAIGITSLLVTNLLIGRVHQQNL